MRAGNPLVVGVGMSQFGRQPGVGLKELAGIATKAALADARLGPEALDAVFAANVGAGLITGQESIRGQVCLKDVGIGGKPLFNVENACASGSSAVHLAVAYIRAGLAQCVLALGYEKMAVADKQAPFRAIEACSDVEEVAALKAQLPEGSNRSIFMDAYAIKVKKYFAASGGAGPRHLAAIAAKNHSNGVLNPYAQFRQAQTTESVLASRAIVEPLTLLMCSPISDGAAAVIVASPDWARAHGLSGPEVAATAVRSESFSSAWSQVHDTTLEAYRSAGIGPQDVHVAEVHDGTAAGELLAYEELGFAPYGAGWQLVDEGATRLGGRVPVNPSGGLLARGHPLGATGTAQICELTWQLRGSAGERQVKGARVAVAQCSGGDAAFARTSGSAAMSVMVLRA
ncbi:MAG: thiolase family protein [Burkholderiales bacterium]|nr:thiolase family protein [Burkholderiales bacterium]